MPKKVKGNLPRATPEEAKKIIDLLDKAIVRYDGIYDELEPALGAYLFARHVGWKPLVLIHNKRTIRKFEEVLGIKFREEFLEAGPDAERSNAYRIAIKLSNFWKAVSGDVKVEGRRQID
jgi:hypothetical protein